MTEEIAMGKHRVTTNYRGALGLPRRDVREIDVPPGEDPHDRIHAVTVEVDERTGGRVTGGWSEPV